MAINKIYKHSLVLMKVCVMCMLYIWFLDP